jgi:hypothetical protein
VAGLEGQAKRLHSFWPRGRKFNSCRAHFEKTLIFFYIFVLSRAMPFERSLFTYKVGKSLALFNKKSSFDEDGFLPL